MFLSILQDAIEQYILWAYVFPNESNLAVYLQKMLEYSECLLQYARLNGDWTGYKKLSSTFLEKIAKLNKSVEKKIVESKERHRFFGFMRSRLRSKI